MSGSVYYSICTFDLPNWSWFTSALKNSFFLPALFYLRRENGKRGRERINQTQNQRVRGLFFFFLTAWKCWVFPLLNWSERKKNRKRFISLTQVCWKLKRRLYSVTFVHFWQLILSFTSTYPCFSVLLYFDKQLMKFSASNGRYVCGCENKQQL